MRAGEYEKFSWQLPVIGLLAASLTLLPTLIWGFDGVAIFAFFAIAALMALIVPVIVARQARQQKLAVLCMLFLFLGPMVPVACVSNDIRSTARWVVGSHAYKRRVLEQPSPTNGTLRHIEWEGWGFAGAGDTTVYLVYDPLNHLNEAVERSLPGKPDGILCEVAHVHRLERDWYTVLFYTDTDWGDCAEAQP